MGSFVNCDVVVWLSKLFVPGLFHGPVVHVRDRLWTRTLRQQAVSRNQSTWCAKAEANTARPETNTATRWNPHSG